MWIGLKFYKQNNCAINKVFFFCSNLNDNEYNCDYRKKRYSDKLSKTALIYLKFKNQIIVQKKCKSNFNLYFYKF